MDKDVAVAVVEADAVHSEVMDEDEVVVANEVEHEVDVGTNPKAHNSNSRIHHCICGRSFLSHL